MVDILIRPKNYDILTIPYEITRIRVKKYSFRYYISIIIEKIKGNDVCIIER